MPRRKLFRSKSGEVLCLGHLPRLDSTQWVADGWVEIPDTGQQGAACGPCARHDPAPLTGPLILNVDDRPATLYLRERVLRDCGFAVMNAATGKAALDSAHRTRPAAILLDVHLPDADGRELCEAIKHDPRFESIPVVLISATLRGQSERAESVRDHHADAFVMEPVTPADLAHIVRKVLGLAA